jgi:putative phosphoribosyl transferase
MVKFKKQNFRENIVSTPIVFKNRMEAGKMLAERLKRFAKDKPIILGMPRGGVVLAYEIARELNAVLDVIVVRKIGAPAQPEYAIGAIAPNDVVVFNPEASALYDPNSPEVQAIIASEQKEMARRIKLYRGKRKNLDLKGKTVIVVDDGLATGQSALAAILALKKMCPGKIILAVGVCAFDAADLLRREVDELIYISIPAQFYAVGLWYKEFTQTTDEEVIALLGRNAEEQKLISV